MKKKNKYTIFGHKGFLGQNIIAYLKKNNLGFFLPKKRQFTFSKNLNNIIYCIGIDDVFEDPLSSIKANFQLASKIILENKFDSFIFISTTRIYFNSNKTAENDLIHINPNSKNYFFNCLKLSAENFCLSQKNKNIKVVRLSNLYGDHFGKQKYLLPTLIRNSLKKNVIDININKNSKKNYLNVEDAIDVIFKIIHKGKYRLYNVASKKLYTLNFIAKNIQKVTGCKIIYRNQKYKYNEPKININRIKKEFNFKEKNNFGEKLINILKK